MLPIGLVCLLLLLCGYLAYRRQRRARQCLAHLPTYPQLPLIGNAHYLLGGERHIFHLLKQVTEICEEKQLPFAFWMMSYPCLVFTDVEDVKCITTEFIERPYYYNFFKQWMGDALFTAPADTWKRNVKKIGKIHTSGMVDGFQNIYNLQAQRLVQKLKNEVGGTPFDIRVKYLGKTALEIILQIALGVTETSDSPILEICYTELQKTINLIHSREFNFFLHSDFLFQLSSNKREMTKAVNTLHEISAKIIKTKLQGGGHNGCNGLQNNITENTSSDFKSYLDILLEINQKDPTFTLMNVKNEIDGLLFAAQDTMASSLFFTLLLLGSRPNVQDKLYAEIHEIFGDSKREVTKEDLTRMTYCEAVIHESLRLYPPVPIIFRVAEHELQLKSCTIPKGANCVVNIYGMGRSKKYWGPDADEFRPERFESSSMQALIPFSTGRRSCMGKKYAMALMKTILAYCIRELVFISTADKIELKAGFLLRTAYANLLQVHLR